MVVLFLHGLVNRDMGFPPPFLDYPRDFRFFSFPYRFVNPPEPVFFAHVGPGVAMFFWGLFAHELQEELQSFVLRLHIFWTNYTS